jgi:hypothetical protein
MPLRSRRAHVGVWATDTRLETESLEDDKMLEDGRLGLLDGRVLDIFPWSLEMRPQNLVKPAGLERR